MAQVRIKGCSYDIMIGMAGTASILVSNGNVLQRILLRITDSL